MILSIGEINMKKTKRTIITVMASIIAITSVASLGASAKSSSRSVKLNNGYTHKLSFNISSSSGTSTFSITNGGACNIKNSLTAVEYTSNGAFVRNVSSNAATSYTTSRNCSVSRKTNSDVLKNFVGVGYNYSSSAKERVSGDSYFKTIEIGNAGIETNVINP